MQLGLSIKVACRYYLLMSYDMGSADTCFDTAVVLFITKQRSLINLTLT